MSILLSMINFSVSNLFRIELIFRWTLHQFVWWLSFHFLKPRFWVKGSYFRQWRWQFSEAIIVAQSSKNRFAFYNCARSFSFHFKIYLWPPEIEDPLKKNRFCEKRLLTLLKNSSLILINLYLINECHHSTDQ